jgi:hypothetical protein
MQYKANSPDSDSDVNYAGHISRQDLVANSFRPQRTLARHHVAIDSCRQDILAYKAASSSTSSQLSGSAWSPAESASQVSFPPPTSGLWPAANVTSGSKCMANRRLWPAKIDPTLNTSDNLMDDDWYDYSVANTIK